MQVHTFVFESCIPVIFRDFWVPPPHSMLSKRLKPILAPKICMITSLLISLMGSRWKVELKFVSNRNKAKVILTLTRKVTSFLSCTCAYKWCKFALTTGGGLSTGYKIHSISTKIRST